MRGECDTGLEIHGLEEGDGTEVNIVRYIREERVCVCACVLGEVCCTTPVV